MEEEALAKLQREKRSTFPSASKSASNSASKSATSKSASNQSSLPSHVPLKARSATAPPQKTSCPPPPSATVSRPEKDLIVFPESKLPSVGQFTDIDVEKLTDAELERLLLDDTFSASRPLKPTLLGFNLSASYPGRVSGPAPAPAFPAGQWSVPNPPAANTPSPLFPTAPYPKFQNGFPAFMPQPFLPFTPPPPNAALVFPPQAPPPKVDPAMVKLFDKIASTSEYVKNGRSANNNTETPDLTQTPVASLEPKAAAESSSGMARFDWLDLDPLTRRKSEAETDRKSVV